MEFALLGWPEDDPSLELDHERFPYAGKFVMTTTGKAVARADETVAAASFSPDYSDPDTLCVRYVSVRTDRQGEQLGPRLLAFVRSRADDRGFERVTIGVNNPFSYQAAYRAGFGYTGERSGLAELTLAAPGNRSPERYQSGLDAFGDRDLSPAERAFLRAHADDDPPATVEPP